MPVKRTVIAASTLRIAERIAKLADDTAKETKNVTASAVAASKVGLARAVEIGRENVLPEIERASAKIKEHTRRDKLERDYRTYLLKLQKDSNAPKEGGGMRWRFLAGPFADPVNKP